MTKKNTSKMGMSDKTFNVILNIIIFIIMLIILYPLIMVISSSFSSGTAVTSGQVLLWPVDFSLTGYELVFQNNSVWNGYLNSIFYTVCCTTISVILTILTAYPLSRNNFQGKPLMNTLFLIPMFFGGGLIPTYINATNLGLVNSRWGMVAMAGLTMSHVVIMRTFFQSSIPTGLHEAAQIDGINDFQYLFQVILPLSKASLAVISLYNIVGNWNAYFGPMIYLRDRDLFPLQLVLREILASTKVDLSQFTDPAMIAKLSGAAEVMKFSLIVVATVPMLILYPFIQKFFEKGVMVGSLKG